MTFSEFEQRWTALDRKPCEQWTDQDEKIEMLMTIWSEEMAYMQERLFHLGYEKARAGAGRYAAFMVEVVSDSLQRTGDLP
jgi:hypothetical protein